MASTAESATVASETAILMPPAATPVPFVKVALLGLLFTPLYRYTLPPAAASSIARSSAGPVRTGASSAVVGCLVLPMVVVLAVQLSVPMRPRISSMRAAPRSRLRYTATAWRA